MKFGLSLESSSAMNNDFQVSEAMLRIDEEANSFFRDKDYGPGIQELYIGIICIVPEHNTDNFFSIRKKYSTRYKRLSYDIQLDTDRYKGKKADEIYPMLKQEILESVPVIAEKKIKQFDLERFAADLETALA